MPRTKEYNTAMRVILMLEILAPIPDFDAVKDGGNDVHLMAPRCSPTVPDRPAAPRGKTQHMVYTPVKCIPHLCKMGY